MLDPVITAKKLPERTETILNLPGTRPTHLSIASMITLEAPVYNKISPIRTKDGRGRKAVPVRIAKELLPTINQAPAPPTQMYKQIRFRVKNAKATGIPLRKRAISNARITGKIANHSTTAPHEISIWPFNFPQPV